MTEKMETAKSPDERLKALYPAVDERQTPLPRCWSQRDKFTYIGLSQQNLRVHYKGTGRNHHKDAASVRATHPIPAACGVYYFEVKIISKGRDGYMGVGLSANGVNMNRLPGWDKQSYGYHGDDGHSFCSSGTGTPYGPTFTTGDVIGCGVDMVDSTCFYTKNGKHLGVAFSLVPANLYPTVGLQTPGEIVDANFGQQTFMFDIETMLDELRSRTKMSIEQMPVDDNRGEFQRTLHRLTLSYLLHHGHRESAQAFAKSVDLPISEPIESITTRQKIHGLVLSGRIREAIELTDEHYPNLLKSNGNLLFRLKCRHFIEMIIDFGNCSKGKKAQSPQENPNGSESGTSTDFEDAESMEVDDSQPIIEVTEDTDSLQRILDFGKELSQLRESLSPEDEKLQKIQSDAFALLAYPDPTQSPMAYLLDTPERDSVSDALNSAILESMSHPVRPSLELGIAHCKHLLQFMAKNGLGISAFADLEGIIN